MENLLSDDKNRILLLASGLFSLGEDEATLSAKKIFHQISFSNRACVRDEIIRLSIREKMLPMLSKFVRCVLTDDWDDLSRLEEVYRVAQTKIIQEVSPVIKEIAKKKLKPLILKGADLSMSFYSDSLPRMMQDFDLLVQPAHIKKAESIFRDFGFEQGNIDRSRLTRTPIDDRVKAQIMQTHYEIPPYSKVVLSPALHGDHDIIRRYCPTHSNIIAVGETVYQIIEVDIHFNVSLNTALDDIWSNCRVVQKTDGLNIYGLSNEAMIWFLCGRTYSEILKLNKPAMRLFVDLMCVLLHARSAVNWDLVINTCEKYNMLYPLFYCLFHSRSLVKLTVKEEILAAVRKRTQAVDARLDYGDFAPKMIGKLSPNPII